MREPARQFSCELAGGKSRSATATVAIGSPRVISAAVVAASSAIARAALHAPWPKKAAGVLLSIIEKIKNGIR